jgi:ABC-type Fe3+/spermidine/putrescine transport system ATPase subunit
LKDTTILENATPFELYNYPKFHYTAALFGEINEIEINGKIQLLYPNQLQIVEKSNIQVEVVASYFKGKYYLIEAKLNNQMVFFESEKELLEKSSVYLTLREI